MPEIRQITIIGTGSIGGSLALALKGNGFPGRVVGCDREAVLEAALRRGAVDTVFVDPVKAAQGSDVVVLSTPVGAILDLLERIGPLLPEHVLITDVGSTKSEVAARAQAIFGDAAPQRFLPGHPMAGKEHCGIEVADGTLFRGAIWLFTPLPKQDIHAGLAGEYVDWISRIGARVLTMDAARHDQLCAWISHLPQMVSTALASVLEEQFGNDPDLRAIGGRMFREMTRVASSPYSMWRDVALTNTDNIQEALLRLEQRLAHIRENLKTRELEAEFARAAKFKNS